RRWAFRARLPRHGPPEPPANGRRWTGYASWCRRSCTARMPSRGFAASLSAGRGSSPGADRLRDYTELSRPVLVVPTQPEGLIAALVATHRRSVEQAVVGHRRLETARGGDIGPVDRPFRERVRAQPRSLRDVAGDVGPGRLRVLRHRRGNLALEEGAQLLLGVGEAQVAIEVGAAG